jgi:Rad3-related DNA helicase
MCRYCVILKFRRRDNASNVVRLFKAAASTDNGAVFLAVCRGKLSEGCDLPAHCARMVVVAGVPFVNMSDFSVRKKAYETKKVRALIQYSAHLRKRQR